MNTLEFILLVSLIAALVYLVVKNMQWKSKFEQRVRDWIENYDKDSRRDAVERSARTLSGKTMERFVPFLEKFGYDPHDVRWLGDPIDFVIFDGYSKNKEIGPDRIVFMEVKSGGSKLSKVQRKIRDIIDKRRISWSEFHL